MTDELREADLLPCPFCGGEAYYARLSGSHGGIKCQRCNSSTDLLSSKAEAIAAWNRRVSRPSTDGEGELGWLVEVCGQSSPTYFAGVTADATAWPHCLSTGDHLAAVRFARRADAEAVVRSIGHANPCRGTDATFLVVEHMWARPSEPAGDEEGVKGPGYRFSGSDAELAAHLFQGERDLHAVGEGELCATYNCALPAFIGEAAERLLSPRASSPSREEVARVIAERALGLPWEDLPANRADWRRRLRSGTSLAEPGAHQDELLDAADAIHSLFAQEKGGASNGSVGSPPEGGTPSPSDGQVLRAGGAE